MVLEDASTPSPTSSDSFVDTPPQSDQDPYSTTTNDGSSSGIQIDLRKIPQPRFGIRFPDELVMEYITSRIQHASQRVGRPLTQDEAMVMAEHTGGLLRITSYAIPAGFLFGAYRAYSTRASYRFPFVKMDKTKFNPNKFWMLEGFEARMSWHLARMTAYSFVGGMFCCLFFPAYAAAVTAAREVNDPRLRALNRELFERSRRRSQGPIAQPSSRPRPRTDYGDDASPSAATGFNGDGQFIPSRTDDLSVGGQAHSAEDTSPMAVQQTDDPYASSDGGSAWERLRKQAGSSGGSTSPFPSTTELTSNADGSPGRDVWAARRQAALKKDGKQEDSNDIF